MTRARSSLPYQIHTNRELGMMLRMQKPLAVFADAYERFPQAVLRYLRLFDRHVAEGTLLRMDYVELAKAVGWARDIHVVMFAQPGEAWRFEAMVALRAELSNWSLEKERREGELLGYSDRQNDLYAAHVGRHLAG